jgi:hypothetical protein
MIFAAILSVALVGQSNQSGEHRPDRASTVTLIVVASDRTPSGGNEFLVLRSLPANTIAWSFVLAKGFTENGLDPEGETQASGSVQGDAEVLRTAFEKTLGTKKTPVQRPRKGKKRTPDYFSLVLIEPTRVRTCQLWSVQQQKQLIFGKELKSLFSDVRKNVFGTAYSMPDLLRVGMDRDVSDPEVPTPGGPLGPPPPWAPNGNQGAEEKRHP